MKKFKKLIAKAFAVVACVAAVVFLFAPVNTSLGITLCIVSVMVGTLSWIVSQELDDDGGDLSFWPKKPPN